MYLTINWYIKTGWRGIIVWDFRVQRKLVLWLARQLRRFFFFWRQKKSPDRRLAVSKMYWPKSHFNQPKKLLMSNSSSDTVADLGESPRGPAPTLLIFRSNWGPKGRKKIFWDRSPPPPPYLKVWICHFDRQVYNMLHKANSKIH